MSRTMWILVLGLLAVAGTIALVVSENRTDYLAERVLEADQERAEATPTEIDSDTAEQHSDVISQWLARNSFGEIDWMSPAPDWEKGKRTNVVTKNGKELLFYFAEDKLCGVWTVDPREQLFKDESC